MNQPEFNIGVVRPVECFKEGWEMIKDQYLLVLGIVLVGMIVGSMFIIITGPMLAGIYLALLAKHDTGTTNFELLFKGFNFFLPSLLLMLLITVPVIVMIILVYIPLIGIAFAGGSMGESEFMAFMIATVAIELVFAVIMVCIHTLLLFAFPLIVDRQLGPVAAVKLSARAVWKNLGGVAGLFVVGFIATLAGFLVFCIGMYLVLPVVFASTVVAYRKVFPRLHVPHSVPPPPTAYANL